MLQAILLGRVLKKLDRVVNLLSVEVGYSPLAKSRAKAVANGKARWLGELDRVKG
jgi:hypothetical protein